MSKIVLNDVTNLNALSVINDNFDKLEQELQNKVLYRDNPEGEPNTLENDVDANGNSLYNIQDLTIIGSFTVNGLDIEEVITEATQGIEDNALAAQNAATAAGISAASASASATAADASEANALASENAAAASEDNAEASATAAASSASTANTAALAAISAASGASSAASNAATSASTATTQAGVATTKAGEASTSATNAASSATAAAASASAAATFNPALYLAKSDNLSGLANTVTARDNLGVEIGVDVQAYSPQLASYAAHGVGMRNRIINGAMVIDQRGSASSPITATSSDRYSVDRFASYIGSGSGVFTAQQSSTAPSGFVNSMKTTVTTTDSSLAASDNYQPFVQYIEGLNTADFGWGAASAATVTVSFWARSSVTGTYPVSIRNSGASRSYVTTFTISAADTWEYKTMTIAGDTSGTWLTTNGMGVNLNVASVAGSDKQAASLNTWLAGNYTSHSSCTNWVASSGATFYITGVQLEKGSTATSFDYRPYSTELALCQRYYETGETFPIGYVPAGSNFGGTVFFKNTKRTTPTIVQTNTSSVNVSTTTQNTQVTANGFTSFRNATVTGTNQFSENYTASAEL